MASRWREGVGDRAASRFGCVIFGLLTLLCLMAVYIQVTGLRQFPFP